LKNPKKKKNYSHPQSTAKYLGTETPEPIDTKFCMWRAVHDVITHANFGEDRLRGFCLGEGSNFGFSIDLLRRLYNTLALPCECVIELYWVVHFSVSFGCV